MKTSVFVSIAASVFIVFTILSLPSVLLSNYYVAPDGNNSNDGSLTSPWATILHAMEKAQPGDTVFVRGGTYDEGEIWIRQTYGMGGRDSLYVTICAFPGETPIFTNGSRGMIIDASYLRVIGLNFRNGKEMYNVDWGGPSHHIELIKNHFSGTPGYAAIALAGDHNLVERNIINISGNSVGTQGHGIYVAQGAYTIIRDNFISGASGYGIHVYVQGQSQDPPGYVRAIKDVLIENNFIRNSQNRSGIILATGGANVEIDSVVIRYNVIVNNALNGIVVNGWSEIRNIHIYHNTIFGNTENGIQLYQKFRNIVIKNNIIYTNPGANHIDNDSNAPEIIVERNLYFPTPMAVRNITDTNPLVGDPMLNNPSWYNFNLNKGSIAIDAGVDLGLPFKGAAPDLGALEFDPVTAVWSAPFETPQSFELWQSAPNPMRASAGNAETVINFKLPFESSIDLSIFNLLGQHVRTLVRGQRAVGLQRVAWDGLDDRGVMVASGVYVYRLTSEGHSLTRKMIFVQ